MGKVRFGELVSGLDGLEIISPPGSTHVGIGGISYDSRQVRPQDLFVAIRGLNFDGHEFAGQAVAAGAVAVLGERVLTLPETIAQAVVSDSREALGLVSARFYGHPSQRLRLIGVTGTNGKTTTTYLIKSILEASGQRTGLIGTIKSIVGDTEIPSTRTTPEASDLQQLLARMVEAGARAAVMEVSSHAVSLRRIAGACFAAGVFTNITQDHLDYHGTFENYLAAKASFFAGLGPDAWAVINVDDPRAADIRARCHCQVITFGLSPEADVWADGIDVGLRGVTYTARFSRQGSRPLSLPLSLRLTGLFNVYNSLAALACGLALGVDPEEIRRGLESVTGVPGRLELIDVGQPFAVAVDYAHTPDGIENVLRAARHFAERRIIIAFGAGGDRDRGKRPLMGEAAARLADYVIITSDNPRSEDPERICADVAEGVRRARDEGGKVAEAEIIVDRTQAIKRAINLARSGDVVILAGKGHETYQIFRDRTIHFDDREKAREALLERKDREGAEWAR